MKAATIREVAAHAGVSIKTVSRVVNHEPHVTPGVRERVEAAVVALSYRPNASARSLSSSRSYLLGLFIDNPGSGYAADVQLGAINRCREAGYHLVVEPVDVHVADFATRMLDTIATLRLDGVILTPPLCDDARVVTAVTQSGVAHVSIAPDLTRTGATCVYMDDEAAAREMTNHLIGLGHREIGFIVGDPGHSVSQVRLDGFRAALAEAGLPLGKDAVQPGAFTFRSGVEAARALLGGPDRPTAIFASNDFMALGALSVANRLGLAVPGALSIAGFDDVPAAREVWPSLTTVRQPNAEMAATAVDLVIATAPGAPRQMLPYTLVLRESTGPAPQ